MTTTPEYDKLAHERGGYDLRKMADRPAEEAGVNAPVAWQERQTLAPQPGWTDWYPTNYEGVKGRTEAFEMTSSGITYQWRPLFLARGAAAAAPSQDAEDVRAELHLLEEVCAFYANDEDRYLREEGEAYGSIPTEVGMKARAARRRFNDRAAQAQGGKA